MLIEVSNINFFIPKGDTLSLLNHYMIMNKNYMILTFLMQPGYITILLWDILKNRKLGNL
jgi:hypothetical protein